MISQPRSLVLDGCPMFAPAYMGRKRIFPMLSLDAQGLLLLAAVFSPHSKSVGRGCALSFSAHVRWGEHGAPVQGRGLRSLLPHGGADEPPTRLLPQPHFRPTGRRFSFPSKSTPKLLPHPLIWTGLAELSPSHFQFAEVPAKTFQYP